MSDPVRWWEIRPAQSTKPATYVCPLCGGQLPALSAHMLLFPEADQRRRRHAHSACVLDARRRGALLTRSEWEASSAGPRRARRRRRWWRA